MPVEEAVKTETRPLKPYLLTRGSHSDTIKGEDGNPTPKTYRAREAGNNVVMSHVNLAKKWPEKFKALNPVRGEDVEDQLAPSNPNPIQVHQSNDLDELARKRATYDAMTVDELRGHAGGEGVDLTGANRKAEIIDRLIQAGV